ncbi:MAG: dethiobiotin synthase [Bdellovibrionales bacterium]|nr:dethiobiotin synthase [Bdellovibrionales bacterium]
MDGIFVTGTDTGIGKTTVSAGLLKLLYGYKKVAYWKPVQTGTVIGDDTHDVRELTELGEDAYLAPEVRFADPVAPYEAAKKWKQTINLDALTQRFREHARDRFVIVEGAGGLLVPMTETELQDTFIRKLGIPALIVAADQLGSINHTLLTINQCRASGIEILGVVLSRSGHGNAMGNKASIERYTNVKVLAELTEQNDRRAVVAAVSAHPVLRKLFGVAELPE